MGLRLCCSDYICVMVILCKNFYLVYKKGGRDKFFQNLYIAIERMIRKWQRKNAGTYFSKFKHCYLENGEKMAKKMQKQKKAPQKMQEHFSLWKLALN